MAIKHVRDGEDFFSGAHRGDHEAFGFHGSLSPLPTTAEKPQSMDFSDTHGTKHVPEPMEAGGGDYATGGEVHQHPHGHHVVHTEHRADGAMVHHHSHGGHSVEHPDGHMTHHHHDGSPVHHMAHGGGMGHHLHPHGHHITRVEHRSDGAVVHHHAHGGHTVHHAHGIITHHHGDGTPVNGMAHGGHMGHDAEAEYAHGGHHADRADLAQDKAMIRKAVGEHENHEHHGEHTDLHLRGGGRARLPRDMKPVEMRPHSPINMPPRKPQVTRTPPNSMPGGVMPYGTQPSDEGGMAGMGGDDTGATPPPGMHRGGAARRRERHHDE